MKQFSKSLLNSPILHFILLGTVAFVAYTQLKPPDRETITVTTQTIDALVQQRESIIQNPTTPEERQSLIEGHIEDEVLLREAYKRDIDKNDYRVRKRILTIMRSSLSEVVPEPSVQQLRKYYEDNRGRYMTSSSRSFEHVYFSFNSTKLPKDAKAFIRQLETGFDLSKLGEYTLMGNQLTEVGFQRTAASFGKPFAEAIFEMPLNRWHGPVESFKGIHYVRVTAAHEPRLPPFEKMESYLRTDYLLTKGRESQVRKIKALMKKYEIVVDGK